MTYKIYTIDKILLKECVDILENNIKLPPHTDKSKNYDNWRSISRVIVGLKSILLDLDRQDIARKAPYIGDLE